MATAIIIDKTKSSARIYEKTKKVLINNVSNGSVKVSEILPFRISFKNIGISSYGPHNPAPIGIAIIGFNNYIL